MNCPKCKGETKVNRTYLVHGQLRIRERGCKECGYRYNTSETAVKAPEGHLVR